MDIAVALPTINAAPPCDEGYGVPAVGAYDGAGARRATWGPKHVGPEARGARNTWGPKHVGPEV